VLTLSGSASGAIEHLGIGGNLEAGVAINLKSGYLSFYAHAGPTAGVGGSFGGEAAVQWASSIDETVGKTGSPLENSVEGEAGAEISPQLVGDRRGIVGAGLGAGPGAGAFLNHTAVAASTPAIHWKDFVKLVVVPTILSTVP
jgi:hypothetical protein